MHSMRISKKKWVSSVSFVGFISSLSCRIDVDKRRDILDMFVGFCLLVLGFGCISLVVCGLCLLVL